MEIIRGILRRSQKIDATTEVTEAGSSPTEPMFGTDLNRPIAPSLKPGSFLNEEELTEENQILFQNIKIAKKAAIEPVRIPSERDVRNWSALDSTFEDDIKTLQLIYWEQLGEIEQKGAASWLEVASIHAISIGSEIVARRNLQQQLSLARKYDVEDRKTPYLQLLEFLHGPTVSIRVGDITLLDFLAPRAKSPVGRYRFLTQVCLVVHRNLYDEILKDNMEPPKNAYPNMIKRTLWTLPNTINPFLIMSPDIMETTYKDTAYPLNEMGRVSAQLMRGIQDVMEEAFKLILNPHSEHFQELRQVTQGYFSSGDRETIITALYLLGITKVSNIREIYRRSRGYAREGIEQEFFSQLGDLVFDYAKEARSVADILSGDDIAAILDMDGATSAELTIPSFEQLGKSASETFNLSSRKNYDIDPKTVVWGNLEIPQAVRIDFDPNRPRKFTVKLEYDAEEGEPDIGYTLDTSKNTMDWDLIEDPMAPENSDIDYLRKNLFVVTGALLQEVARQAKEKYLSRHQPKVAEPQPQQQVKRERFDDQTYKLRKEIKAEEKEKKRAAKPLEERISIGDFLHDEGIKKQVGTAEGETIDEKFIGVSPGDQEIIKKAIAEFNERGVGDFRMKSTRPGSEPRYDLRISCSAPKGARVLMRESNSGNGTRRFEIINITYRSRTWRINKLW